MCIVPTPDMSGWSILDFELAFDGVCQVNDACVWMQNQPRAEGPGYHYHPGAAFIVALGENWCASVRDAIVKRLAAIRFDNAEDDDRRIRLLVRDATDYGSAGEDLVSVLAMIAKQRLPIAA